VPRYRRGRDTEATVPNGPESLHCLLGKASMHTVDPCALNPCRSRRFGAERWGVCLVTTGGRLASGEGVVKDHALARRHIFAINASPEFLNIVRELFQGKGYHVTTTNFAPNFFAQIEALQPDALIIDIAIGQEAGGKYWSS
jgi:hypothetical protein